MVRTNWLPRFSLPLAIAATLAAQVPRPPQNPSPMPGPGAPGVGAPSTNTPGTGWPPPTVQPPIAPQPIERPMYLSGRVVMDDGTPPPDRVLIQLTCNAFPKNLTYTDAKGFFSVDVRDRLNRETMADAADPYGGLGMGPQGRTTGVSPATDPIGDLMGCRVGVSFAGFRADEINLGSRRSLDDPNIGILILHRLANVEGLTISATTAMAPKDAKKDFDKGRNDEQKKKWDDAAKEFNKAVETYPRYAVAWFELGNVQLQQKNMDEARNSYGKALAADPKFVSPYLELAGIALDEKKWQEAADDSDRLLKLNPVDFPQAWLSNAIANYNLQKLDLAQKSAEEGLRRDPLHRFPKMNHLLGVLLAQKADYAGSAQNLQDYLKYAPNASDTDLVRQQLTKVQSLMNPQAQK